MLGLFHSIWELRHPGCLETWFGVDDVAAEDESVHDGALRGSVKVAPHSLNGALELQAMTRDTMSVLAFGCLRRSIPGC